MLCEAKPPILFSILFYLFIGNDILEKREKREVKREKYKKERQSSFENCRSFLAGVDGFEPPEWQIQNLLPYRLAIPHYSFATLYIIAR